MKSFTTVLVLLLLVSTSATAQTHSRTWAIKANLGAFLNFTNVSIEKMFCKRQTLSLVPAYGFLRSENATYKTVGLGIDYKYFFGKMPPLEPKGVFVVSGVSFANGRVRLETNGKKADVQGNTFHAEVGKSWIFKKGFTVDVHAGVQYINLDVTSEEYKLPYNGFLPAIGGGIGYAF